MCLANGPILALDAASPWMSAAIARDGHLLAESSRPGGPGAGPFIALVDEVTRQAALAAGDLAGVVAVRGPGSFTGVRLALATAWALHESLGLAARAVTSFQALACQVEAPKARLLALVDALRGEWYAQLLAVDQGAIEVTEPAIEQPALLGERRADLAIGFGASKLRRELPNLELREPRPLAAPLACQISRSPWAADAATLLAPLYLRAPTPETRRAGTAGADG